MIEVREPREEELEEMYAFRWKMHKKVFGLAKGTERDEKEEKSEKVVAVDGEQGRVVGSARLTSEGQVNYMSVEEGYRSLGIGKRIMEYLHKKAKEKGMKKIKVEARKTAEEFYKKLGYVSLREYVAEEPYNQEEVEMVREI